MLAIVLLILVPVATEIPALATLAVANVLIWALIAYETRIYGEARRQRPPPREAKPGPGPGLLGATKVAGSGPIRSPVSSPAIAAISSSLELEVEDVDVLADPLGRHRLGDDDVAELQVPAQDRLRRGLAMLLGDPERSSRRRAGTLGERAPGLGRDPCSACQARSSACWRQRMQLDLVDRRPLVGLVAEALEVLDAEVRDADRPRPALLMDPLEGPPGVDVAVLGSAPASGSGRGRRAPCRAARGSSRTREGRVVALLGVPELGRDEDLLARHARGGDRLPRPPPRCRRRQRCRCGGSRPAAPPRPPDWVSSGGTWKTPNRAADLDAVVKGHRRDHRFPRVPSWWRARARAAGNGHQAEEGADGEAGQRPSCATWRRR